ncbi:PDZ domain-containing protein [Phragmitibacter flavus]|uniref:PDZ domain-containing protein n=1 Tax=Phragmitibacter flavus TaxID=2576071 RepID=A0A5R8KBN8_9BACT|nr:trypsin-like peptidase domain-containing protein [Phragmitibacter flavus]TLD69733.1 PDZ domain-containing protein [Phragmitibacter flavus]
MKKPRFRTLTYAGVGLAGLAAFLYAEEVKTEEAKVENIESKIAYDHSEIANSGQLVMSYADVVEQVLPSVASISTFAKPGQQRGPGGQRQLDEEDLEALPPMFREFFRDYMERNGPQGEEQQSPRNQRRQRQQAPVRTGLGSGFVLTEDGYIVTNNHVVDNSDELKVTVGNASREYTAKVVGKDPQSDVALIKIDAKGLIPAKIGDSSKVRVGDVVLAMGSPMGLDQSVTQGIVSAKGRSQLQILSGQGQMGGYEDFIQTDAAINPGNSGGPLVDAKGRVIGVNTAIQTRTGMFAGIGLSIPSNMAVAIALDLAGDGKVERGFLGIQMGDVDSGMAEFLGLKDDRGVTVTAVVDDSPAAKAGFQSGDVIVTVDGSEVEDYVKLRLLIGSKRSGETVKFGAKRFNEETKKPEDIELQAVLQSLDGEKVLAGMQRGPGGQNAPALKGNEFLKGVRVVSLNEQLRADYGVPEEVEGLVVTSVEEDSPAGKVGLLEGDVITKVNRKAVKTTAEAKSLRGEAGSVMLLEIFREGQTKFLPVKN